MNGVSLMEMLLNLIFYTLDTAVVMDDMIDSILKLGLCGCYILVQVLASTFHVNNSSHELICGLNSLQELQILLHVAMIVVLSYQKFHNGPFEFWSLAPAETCCSTISTEFFSRITHVAMIVRIVVLCQKCHNMFLLSFGLWHQLKQFREFFSLIIPRLPICCPAFILPR